MSNHDYIAYIGLTVQTENRTVKSADYEVLNTKTEII